MNHNKQPKILTKNTFAQGLNTLCRRDPDIKKIITDIGPPKLWFRKPGFPSLIRIILEQQVSLASAEAAYNRLMDRTERLSPDAFLKLDGEALKSIGFSRQKTAYGRNLAQAIKNKEIDLNSFGIMDNTSVRSRLIQIKGIGLWTADIYLLISLRRADIWPGLDLALAVAVQKVKRLKSRPNPATMKTIGDSWKPWRAVAARVLWHYYLSDQFKKE